MGRDGELFADVLPTYLTRFVGRDSEIAEVASLLRGAAVVTICGVGGAGKTRLAIEVARRVRKGSGAAEPSEVHWVALAAVTDPAEVAAAVGMGIDLPGPVGPRPDVQVANALRGRRLLIVLDNCEQVVAGCRDLVASLVEDCPRVTFLATSRVPLDFRGEVLFPTPPLSGIGDTRLERMSEAQALFIDRCVAAAPGYAVTAQNAEVITEICTVLHGLPLAIELAASWIPVLSARDLLEHLRDGELVVSGSASRRIEDRHRSLELILAGTWRWLGSQEQQVLGALSVFVGGFTRAAAEAVAGADLGSLSRLTERAILQRLPDVGGGTRYQLHDLVRTYAAARMQDATGVRRRHFDYFLAAVEDLDPNPGLTAVEPAWSDPIRADIPNIDAATVWAIEQGDAEGALRIAVGLERFWIFSTPSAATRKARLDAALALPHRSSGVTAIRARAMALEVTGFGTSDRPAAIAMFSEAVSLRRQLGDERGVAGASCCRAMTYFAMGDLAAAEADAADALAGASKAGDFQGVAWDRLVLGCIATARGELDEAVTQLQTSADLFELHNSPLGVCHATIGLAAAHARQGRWHDAVVGYRRALNYQQQHRLIVELGEILDGIANVAAFLHRDPTVARLCGAAATWREALQEWSWFPLTENLVASTVGASRRRMSSQAWEQSFTAGASLSTEDAIRLADHVGRNLADDLLGVSKGLSPREVSILRLVAEGRSDAEIAATLVLSPRTVQTHLRSVFAKLEVNNRTAAVRAAGPVLITGAAQAARRTK